MLRRICSRNATVVASAVVWAGVIGAAAAGGQKVEPHLMLILAAGAAAHIVILGSTARR